MATVGVKGLILLSVIYSLTTYCSY